MALDEDGQEHLARRHVGRGGHEPVERSGDADQAAVLEGVDRGTTDLPAGAAGGPAALDAVCEATRDVNLPTAIATIQHVLGGPGVAGGMITLRSG